MSKQKPEMSENIKTPIVIMPSATLLRKEFSALDDDAVRNLDAFMSDIYPNLPKNTQRALLSDFKFYYRFCQNNEPPLPPLSTDIQASKQVLMSFTRYIVKATYKKPKAIINNDGVREIISVDTPYSRATIKRYISSVSQIFGAAEIPNPMHTDYCRKGITTILNANDKAAKQKQARPLRVEDLDLINEVAPRNTVREKRDILMLNIAFEGLLRVDEVINLKLKNINFEECELSLGKTKTDQEAQGHDIHLSKLTMRLLHDYLNAVNVDENGNELTSKDPKSLYNGYLFRSVSTNGKQLRPLVDESESQGRIDRNAVVTAYRRLSNMADLGGVFSGHSPRVGAAVSLAEAGEDGLTIQREGRWNSPEMPVRYTKKVRSKNSGMAKLRGSKK